MIGSSQEQLHTFAVAGCNAPHGVQNHLIIGVVGKAADSGGAVVEEELQEAIWAVDVRYESTRQDHAAKRKPFKVSRSETLVDGQPALKPAAQDSQLQTPRQPFPRLASVYPRMALALSCIKIMLRCEHMHARRPPVVLG